MYLENLKKSKTEISQNKKCKTKIVGYEDGRGKGVEKLTQI